MSGVHPKNAAIEVQPLNPEADDYRRIHNVMITIAAANFGIYGLATVVETGADKVVESVQDGVSIHTQTESEVVAVAEDVAQFSEEIADAMWDMGVLTLGLAGVMIIGRLGYWHDERRDRKQQRLLKRQALLNERSQEQDQIIKAVFDRGEDNAAQA